jgi:hypothetical protein
MATTAWTRMPTTRILHANPEVREKGNTPGATVARGGGLCPYTLPEMFGISTDPARLSAAGRFHNG